MELEYERLANLILSNASSHNKPRYLVAIAGVPGSGKTTIAAAVARKLNAFNPAAKTRHISMDGFHFDRATLDTFPNPSEAYARRGAPWTFDVSRLLSFFRQLRAWADFDPLENAHYKAGIIFAPSFDHEKKDPVADAVSITEETQIVICEGNYLLLNEAEWREIPELVDYHVFVNAHLEETRDRLARRHVRSGIETSLENAFRRVDSNDYLNSCHIQENLMKPHLIISSVTDADL